MALQQRIRSARGAVLIHVAIAMIAMIALSALAIDLGVNYVGRGQAQTAADAAALAGAVYRSYVDASNLPDMRASALAAARANNVWGQAPDVLDTDVEVVGCPANAPGADLNCVRASVFRTNYQRVNGSPLPTFFAQMVGLSEQGARAQAVAQLMSSSGTADCVKPVAIPDRWFEHRPVTGPWTMTSTFEAYRETGPPAGRGTLLTPADDYEPPTDRSAGSGFVLPADYGLQLTLKEGSGGQGIDPGWYYPVVLDPTCVGGRCYEDAWSGCSSRAVGPDLMLTAEPGNKVGPTRDGVTALTDADPSGWWNPALNGGRGGPDGGCMAAGTCTRSPRWIAVPVFDVEQYQRARALNGDNSGTGRTTQVRVVKVVGFWLEGMSGNDVVGRLTHYPTTNLTGTPIVGPGMFASTIILVR